MNILLFNESWMIYNITLALVAVFAAWLLFLLPKKPFLVALFICIWFIFMPNTIYVITDLEHLFRQVRSITAIGPRIFLIIEYALFIVIGLLTYIFALYPVEKLLLNSYLKRKNHLDALLLICFNFLIGFGIVLGRIERVNSWWVFTKTSTVIESMHVVLSSPYQLFLVLLFGLFANFFYFLFKDPLIVGLYKITKNRRLKKR